MATLNKIWSAPGRGARKAKPGDKENTVRNVGMGLRSPASPPHWPESMEPERSSGVRGNEGKDQGGDR